MNTRSKRSADPLEVANVFVKMEPEQVLIDEIEPNTSEDSLDGEPAQKKHKIYKKYTAESIEVATEKICSGEMRVKEASMVYDIPSYILTAEVAKKRVGMPKIPKPLKNYDEKALQEAIEKVKSREMSMRTAAKTYGVTVDAINRRIPSLKGLPRPPPPQKDPNLKFLKFDSEKLHEAAKKFNSRELSLQKASDIYGIPTHTIYELSREIGGQVPKKKEEPRAQPQILFQHEEEKLLLWLQDGSCLGDPRWAKDLILAASDLGKSHEHGRQFSNGVPTMNWVRCFEKRHSGKVKLRFPTVPFDQGKFFSKFYSYLERKKLLDVLNRPDAFYIIEDTNLELDVNNISSANRAWQKKLLTARRRWEPSNVRSADSVTVTYAFGADGRVLQQLLIFRESFQDMLQVALADRDNQCKFLMTKTHDGENNFKTFRSYLERIDTQLKDVQRPIFIFCKEQLPRVNMELNLWLREKKIHVISFIPSEVSILDVIDETVYGIKDPRGWKVEVEKFHTQKPFDRFSEADFVRVLKNVHDRIFKTDKIQKAFEKAGIFPFDKSRMSEEQSEPEPEVSEEEVKNVEKPPEKVDNLGEIRELIRKLEADNVLLLKYLTEMGNENMILHAKIIEQQLNVLKNTYDVKT